MSHDKLKQKKKKNLFADKCLEKSFYFLISNRFRKYKFPLYCVVTGAFGCFML